MAENPQAPLVDALVILRRVADRSDKSSYNGHMLDRLRHALEEERNIAYALVFGSGARGTLRPASDIDVGIELRDGTPRDPATLGHLTARLEAAAEREVDLVLIEDAPPPLAYRIFRDGRILVDNDHARLSARKARAILDYLDFKPIEERCADGVLRVAAARG